MELYSNRFAVLGVMILASSIGWAQTKSYPMSVNSAVSGESATSAPASGTVTRAGNSNITLKINNTCFATNLRSVSNPVAPTSTITASLTVHIGSKDYDFMVQYPGELTAKNGGLNGDTMATGVPTGAFYIKSNGADVAGSAGTFGNVAVFKTGIPATMTVDGSGNVTVSDSGDIYLVSAKFDQTVNVCNGTPHYGSLGYSIDHPAYDCGQYMGQNGTLSANIGGLSVSSDKSTLEINVAFPGQTGFCGGYYSPLMVFFDEGRPKFSASSEFPLNPWGKTAWPEENSPGWFLAIDDGSGTITKKDQLFGENGDVKNGFEALKALDSNHDGVIDKKDKAFNKLVLWRDVNGDGVSQKQEIVKLSSKITKISLKYNNDILRPIGSYAEERQRAKFWYKDAKGKTKTGDIIDIWLAPVQPAKVTQK